MTVLDDGPWSDENGDEITDVDPNTDTELED